MYEMSALGHGATNTGLRKWPLNTVTAAVGLDLNDTLFVTF
jgi:hypothetical protein